ncbi:hypothetical protein B296_00037314 [Ensete ventricosum]|uniref:DUF834 domain-containing protein n=1 Tax=Ensete ventricosum TaxID=4639 RepID=A0A426Z0K8_ENSVE|nr:hypothetical protein B296_00037314 [Ensete ventricosum]
MATRRGNGCCGNDDNKEVYGRGAFESDCDSEGNSDKRGGSGVVRSGGEEQRWPRWQSRGRWQRLSGGDEEEEINATTKEGLAAVEVVEKRKRGQRGPARVAVEASDRGLAGGDSGRGWAVDG